MVGFYDADELEGVIEALKSEVKKLARAEDLASRRGASPMADAIRAWRITLEALLGLAVQVLEDYRRHGRLAASERACVLESKVRRVYLNIDKYNPVSTGYRPLLINLQEAASRICRG
ncbi:MAG: hypothetical protein GSR84_00505 [Desulfurococcales archaeon]|nr:hypothetical protein [Desulfurococcales archaeon]